MNVKRKRPKVSRASVISQNFITLSGDWCRDESAILLRFVWSAYDQLRQETLRIDTRDLERSITELLELRVRRAMSGDEPFYVQHGKYERETMKPSPAQPPQYDLAFVVNADERIVWPLEAKVLENPAAVSKYADEVRQQFLTCRYAPFSGEGAMIGYLLSGAAAETFSNIGATIPCKLVHHQRFPERPHKTSRHRRAVPTGKSYPINFLCHHLLLEFLQVQRHRVSPPDS